MTESERLHLEAMEFCDEALAARRKGDPARADDLFRRAYEFEREAAALLESATNLEPTRSIIHRSAASLALQCGEVASAREIAGTALRGAPPREIRNELLEIVAEAEVRFCEVYKVNYKRLIRMASVRLRGQSKHLINAEELVLETFARLCTMPGLTDQAKFIRAAAVIMRGILSDLKKRSTKHSRSIGRRKVAEMDRVTVSDPLQPLIMEEASHHLWEALHRLEVEEPQVAAMVRLSYIDGCSFSEAAKILGVSHSAADRFLREARKKLRSALLSKHSQDH